MSNYLNFLESKMVSAESYGFDVDRNALPNVLMDHQKDIVSWSLSGGRRACFASFGLGKTLMQLAIAYEVIKHTGKPFLIGLPLGVIGEFKRDNELLNSEFEIEYIKDSDSVELQKIENAIIDSGDSFPELKDRYVETLERQENVDFSFKPKIYLSNYERIRKGDIDPTVFGGVSFDEASVLRNLKTETTNYVLEHFTKVSYRFVFTATPTPNNYLEILNYAQFLGVIDRGHALTQFFKRDAKKAGNLKLNETQEEEFWRWVATWAVFINKPSDLGYSDEGYVLPKMNIHENEVENLTDEPIINKDGDLVMFKDTTKNLVDTSREKSESIHLRVDKAFDIIQEHHPYSNVILWHHREAERTYIEKKFGKDADLFSVYGSQSNDEKERLLIDYSNGYFQFLSTKPKIAGSGCNFQRHCNIAVFVGIDYKFNDFIQAVHRIYRFGQDKEVHIYIIHTQNEREVLATLKAKWKRHIELQTQMINLVRKYGLNNDKLTSDMKRKIFENERNAVVGDARVWNQDNVVGMDYIEPNSTGMILTSIPFGDHYEYSNLYNDFGHNYGNEKFFEQMDFLTPKLFKSLMPGRVAAVHVKDRIRYSHQTGQSFTSIEDFSGMTVQHFLKHGFVLFGKITVPTDVVQENNQTYRLTWGELVKDATKMGCGLPEYILLFRKPPSDNKNAYADLPVRKSKEEYTLARWQLDAHSIWESNGNRFLTLELAEQLNPKQIYAWWKEYCRVVPYDYQNHVDACETLDKVGKLSKKMMTLMNRPQDGSVMNDISRLRTLNANQVNRKKEKHICPLQLDIIERLIFQYTNEGETVGDPFGGLFSTPYMSLMMKRKSWAFELNPDYYDDGLFYLKSIEYKINIPTLFDLFDEPKKPLAV